MTLGGKHLQHKRPFKRISIFVYRMPIQGVLPHRQSVLMCFSSFAFSFAFSTVGVFSPAWKKKGENLHSKAHKNEFIRSLSLSRSRLNPRTKMLAKRHTLAQTHRQRKSRHGLHYIKGISRTAMIPCGREGESPTKIDKHAFSQLVRFL